MSVFAPASPDTSTLPHHRYELVECLYSADRHCRAALVRDEDGLFRILFELWDLSEWERRGCGFWGPLEQAAAAAESLAAARQIAHRRLVELGVGLGSARCACQ
jgi:hypothetical protein